MTADNMLVNTVQVDTEVADKKPGVEGTTGPGFQSKAAFNCREMLTAARLEKTAWGTLLIQAEARGYFTEAEKRWSIHRWPFDEEFSHAVLNEQLELATNRLITIEKLLADEGWRAVKRYRQENERRR